MYKTKLFLLIMVLLSASLVGAQTYDYTGTINENGDDNWDDDQADRYVFELTSGEAFEFQLTGDGDLDIIIYSGDDDSLEAFADAANNLNFVYSNFDLSTNIDDSFTPTSDGSFTLAVFSIGPLGNSNGDYDYTLTTNVEAEGGFLSFNIFYSLFAISLVAVVVTRIKGRN